AGSLKLDPVTHRVTANGQSVAIGPTEYRLLRFLLARPERVHSRAQLLDQVWGDHVYIEERTVDVHVRRLRLALEPFGLANLIETVRGSGYRLAVPR
ncbi:MAG: winged helix-turn-helix domain-containing protein, partial [Burkholderiales bacterium]